MHLDGDHVAIDSVGACVPATGVFGELAVRRDRQVDQRLLAKQGSRTVHELQADLVTRRVVRLAQLESEVKGVTSTDDEGWVRTVHHLVRRRPVSFGIFTSEQVDGEDLVVLQQLSSD